MPLYRPLEEIMKEIQLTKGYMALVDDEDFERVSQVKWRAREDRKKGKLKNVYATRTERQSNGLRKEVGIHSFILGTTQVVDHKDHNGLNNQRYNLRLAGSGKNARNTKRYVTNTSGFKGVSWNKYHSKWVAYIYINGTDRIQLGYFTDPLEAACAYDMAAVKYHGEFASCNFARPD